MMRLLMKKDQILIKIKLKLYRDSDLANAIRSFVLAFITMMQNVFG